MATRSVIAILFTTQAVLTSSWIYNQAFIENVAQCNSATVYYKADMTYEVRYNVFDKENGAAFGTYSDYTHHTSGFGELQITTNPSFPNNVQSYAAGYLEAALTHSEIHNSFVDLKCQVDCSGNPPPKIMDFFDLQDKWFTEQIDENKDNPYWMHASIVRSQFEGMIAGYNVSHSSGKELDLWAFRLLNGLGDLFDIIPHVNRERRPDVEKMDMEELEMYMFKNSHCSALIKLPGDYSDMYIGHSSWYQYASMNRIYKHYHFNLQSNTPNAPMRKMSFSSYPGMISSLDDFYMMDSGLAMVQTTNNVFDKYLYDLVTPQALLAWHRVRIANSMSDSGKMWYETVKKHNSGTYNNQYMVLDYKMFKPKNGILANTLWVIEQIPDLVYGEDCSKQLELGYWPSFNVPYHDIIYRKSGYGLLDEKAGLSYGSQYQLAPRAKIFRRDAGNVVDLEKFKSILRYNDYENDPYSEGSPMKAICSRGDLNSKPVAGGCYDTKVTNYELFKQMKSYVVNGPTHDNLPPFDWRNTQAKAPHTGQPDLFNFTFEEMTPTETSNMGQTSLDISS